MTGSALRSDDFGSRLTALAILIVALVGAPALGQVDLRKELDAEFLKGVALSRQNKFAEAIPYLENALALAPKVFGPDHLNTAGILNTLARAHTDLGQYAKAEPHLRECLRIREKRLGPTHPQVEMSLGNLAVAHEHLGNFAKAEELFRRCLDSWKARGVTEHEDLATDLNNLAALYQTMGRHDEAEALYRRGLEMREKLLGKDSPGIVFNINNLGNMLRVLNRFGEAEDLLRRGLGIAEGEKAHEHLGIVINSLGSLYQDMGRYAEAEPLFRRSAGLQEKRLGPTHPGVAPSLNNLATSLMHLGRFADAEATYRRALKINENALGPDHPQTVTTLGNLASLYRDLNRHAEAEPLFLRQLKIRETRLGKDHADVATVLVNLGANYHVQGRAEEAEACYVRALKIQEASFGPDSLIVANTLNNLAGYVEPVQAEAYFLRAIKITENKLGYHPTVVTMLNNLALLHVRAGRYKQGEAYLLQCIEVEKKRGDTEPSPMTSNSLSRLYQVTGRPREAWDRIDSTRRHEYRFMHQVFGFSSESAMHAYAESRHTVLFDFVSRAVAKDAPPELVGASLSWTLRLKGVLLDALCRFRQSQHVLNPTEPLGRKAAEYRAAKQRLADLALTPPKNSRAEDLKVQVAQLRKTVNDLEEELNRGMADQAPPVSIDDISTAAVQKRLAAGSALVEFVRSPIRDFAKQTWGPPHYFAYVLTATGEPRLLDLGDAGAIDAAVEELRKEFADFQDKLGECETVEEIRALEKAQEKQFRKTGAAVHARVFAPLGKALGDARLIHLAADGQLNRLPFEALVDDKGKYLVESHRIAYLSSGRDLLRKPAGGAKGTVVLAGPDFKIDPEQRQELASKLLGKKETVARRNMPDRDVRSIGWRPLPGAAAEAGDIRKNLEGSAFGPVKTYVGAEALEDVALKSLAPPRVLHLATHGFSLDHEPGAPAEEATGEASVRSRLKKADNPLLRSGIVLAGANTIGENSGAVEDGWVTAEEIALLNLRGTELVVLSACQTGLGDFKNGEGVYGLRRAFLYAGARTLVTSLFEVPDRETRELMQRFYGRLRAGSGKLDALHGARLDLIRQRRQSHEAAHPFFWASFILAGDAD